MHIKGFTAVEFGPSVIAEWSSEDLVAAAERAGVEVVSICTPSCKYIEHMLSYVTRAPIIGVLHSRCQR